MSPRRSARIVLGLAVTIAAVLPLRVALWRPLAVRGAPPDDGFTRVRGVVHVHTTLSDGGGSPEEVAAAARATGLGFVVITDHNNIDAKRFEGEHGGVPLRSQLGSFLLPTLAPGADRAGRRTLY